MSKYVSQNLIYLLLFLVVILGGFVRLYNVESNPPGLYLDEASIGYNAYKILTTKLDQHGQRYPLFFQAFGEYKFPLYIYATVISMDVFGKNEFAIRFPSAFLGTLTIVLIYILAKKTIELSNKKNQNLFFWGPFLSSFLLAISPWHIQFSRGGFEANVALFFYILGLVLFLIFLESRKFLFILILSFLTLGLTMYTYQAYRVIAPVTIVFCSLWMYKEKKEKMVNLFIALFILILFCLPLFQFILSPSGSIRFAQTSAFTSNSSSLQKVISYPAIFIKNYISFYSTQFLFISGDGIGRHQVPNFGLIPLWESIFVILGFYFVYTYTSPKKYIIFLLFFLSAVPGALTTPSPHALRSLPLVIPLTIFASYGILFLLNKKTKLLKLYMLCICMFALYETTLYFHFYYKHYPITNAVDWGGEYKELVQKVSQYKYRYKYIVVKNTIGDSQIYFSFYDDSLHPVYIDKTWDNPKGWDKKDILFVGNEKDRSGVKIVDTIYAKNKNHDIFAQLWIKN